MGSKQHLPRETSEMARTPRGTFHVTDMSREQMETAGYGFHHEFENGNYLIMANGCRAEKLEKDPDKFASQKKLLDLGDL